MQEDKKVSQSSSVRVELSFTKPMQTGLPNEANPTNSFIRELVSTKNKRINLIYLTSFIAAFTMIQCAAKTLSGGSTNFAGQSIILSLFFLLSSIGAIILSRREGIDVLAQANIVAAIYHILAIAIHVFPQANNGISLWMLLIANLAGPATAFLIIFFLMLKCVVKKKTLESN